MVPAYFWKVDGIGVSVAVSRTVLEGLRASLDQAPPDAEFGGILLGTFAPGVDGFRTQVDAFEAFPIEHRHGQNYRLSARDQRFLEQRLKSLRRKGLAPVGFCRSHHRRGLYLDQRDFDLFRTDFRHPASVFLLVRPQDATAAKGAIFVWEEDDIRRHASYLEFPLPERLRRPAPERAEVAPSLASQTQEIAHAGLSWALRTWADVAGLARSFPSFPPATPAKVLVTIALPLISFYAAREIALQRNSGANQVRPFPQPVHLSIPQIDRDVASAPPPTTDQKPLPFSDTTPAEAPARETIASPPVKTTPISNSRDRADADHDVSPADRLSHTAAAASPARLVPALPDPPPVLPARPEPSLPRMVASRPPIASRPEAVVAYVKPAQPSSIRHAFQKVFTGHSAGDGFVAASPVEHPLPALPPDAVPLEEGATVEMQAKVDRLGNVVNVKVVEGNRQLADASADALLRWRFDPARRNGAPVESAMRVRFEFRNPSR